MKNIATRGNAIHWFFLRTVPKWVSDYAVSLDCVAYCVFYSILFRGGGVFSGHGVFKWWM